MSDFTKLSINYRQAADIVGAKVNPRTHSAAQIGQIAESIRHFGWTNPILVDEQSRIIAGHGRIEAARKLGMAEVPTITLAGLSPEQRRALVIADNQLALNAGWDAELLALELSALKDEGFDVSLLGFDDDELTAILGDPLDAEAPDGFATYDEDINTEHECPKCGYVFSGGRMVPKAA